MRKELGVAVEWGKNAGSKKDQDKLRRRIRGKAKERIRRDKDEIQHNNSN